MIWRQAYVRRLSAWMAGDTPRHPAGRVGERWIIPPQCTSNCWDTAPEAWQYSEYGNGAGFN